MEDTRYWKKSELGGFWSKCRDQDNISSSDGRQLYKYTKPIVGERWQHECRQFGGVIESFFIQEGTYGDALCIGIRSNDRVNVLQIPVWKKEGSLNADFKGMAKKIANININDELDFSTWTNIKGKREWVDKEGSTHTQIPTYIMVYQDNGAMRTSTKSAFDYVDGVYVGVPAAETAELGGRTVYDFTTQNEFFIGLIKDFAKEHVGVLEERRNARPNTPAEAPKAQVEELEDVPF